MPREWRLLLAVLALAALALAGPSVAQVAQYHQFADQGLWHGVPHPGDVLSNLAFAAVGLSCGLALLRAWGVLASAERALLALTACGLVTTCLASGWYHLAPDDVRVAVDRAGMVLAFAGVLGLAGCRVSSRAGLALATLIIFTGPAAIASWLATGDLWPWAVVQGGGAVLLLALAATQHPAALPVRWAWVVAAYALAKLFEVADHEVWTLTGGLVSGHSLKHLVAAWAVLPVTFAVARLVPARQNAAKLPARAA
ncbi:hypothetical protein I8E28_01215 [Ramlibacter sp. CrO1]|uniref:Alkaline phytoceramidase n=2 Tax=Ramlibacter algicola TaxID=2795217 RepID=A0A934UPW7_9BURK|nr:hypothetical protein [Ramlibacter algicola]